MNTKKTSDTMKQDDAFRFQTGIGPTTDRILNYIVEIMTSDYFKEQVSNKILGPVTEMVNNKIRPYIYLIVALYALIVILLLIIIYLQISTKKLLRVF